MIFYMAVLTPKSGIVTGNSKDGTFHNSKPGDFNSWREIIFIMTLLP